MRWLLPLLLLTPAWPQSLDEYIEARREEWKVPGLAVAAVKNGQVVLQSVYGYRDVEKQKPVTRQTLFGIGSVTKSFTALLIASLVEEGKLDWDKPVHELVPALAFRNAKATREATLRDLLSHRTGISRHDELWESEGLARDDLFARIPTLGFDRPFRSKWAYNNLMVMAAGVVAERVAGKPWEDLVRERLFGPMAFLQANTSVTKFGDNDDWAANYELRRGKFGRVDLRVADNIGPAGSINANLDEMTRYLLVHVGSGMLYGHRVYPASWFETVRTPQIDIHPVEIPGEGKVDERYGLCLYLATHRGHRMVWHTGTIGTYHTLLAYLPDDGIGYVSLQNRVVRPLPQLLARHIFDTLLGVAPPDWDARYRGKERKAAPVATAASPSRTRPTSPARRERSQAAPLR